jgi:type IV pilus assembly protein PilX
MTTNRHHRTPPARAATGQRGLVMLFGLLAMVIMMIGAVAMIRSMNTSLSNAGNLGFKRDLTNQGERATALVITALQTGTLVNDLTRQASMPANNYSAKFLPSNAQGMPMALLDNTAFGTTGSATNDIVDAAQSITIRYVLDRMCANDGVAAPSHCTMSDGNLPTGGSGSDQNGGIDGGGPGGSSVIAPQAVYRLSIRVTGPRLTQAFFQTTLSL